MILTLKEKSAHLRCAPNPLTLSVAARLEGRRRWSPDGLTFEPSRHNLDLVRALWPEEPEPVAAEDFEPVAAAPYAPKTAPYPHQVRALERMAGKPAFALFMEQGTGKSKVAVDRAGELWAAGKIDAVLIFSKKGVHRQWLEEQVPRHFGSDLWDAASWPVKTLPPTILARDGRLKWFAINYDGAKSGRGKEAAAEFLRAHSGRVLTIADESQEIKNARSARAEALRDLKRVAACGYRLILTGTPVAKDLTDEWSQLSWLDESILGVRYVTTFRAKFCMMGGFEGREVVGHKNLAEFRARTDPYAFRATKDELGLIPPAFEEWAFDLLPEQRRLIKQVKTELLAQIASGEIVSVANAAVGLSKIQQISNGFVTGEDGAPREIVPPGRNPRLNALEEYLDSRAGEKVIVWARFRRDLAAIRELLDARGIPAVDYHGGTSDAERTAAVKSFLSPGGARVFVSNPQSGGTGLNLQGLCRNAVYYSNGYAAIDRWQSQDRIHRIGTVGAVVYTDLVARGGVDKAILANLRRKKSVSDLAIGDVAAILENEL